MNSGLRYLVILCVPLIPAGAQVPAGEPYIGKMVGSYSRATLADKSMAKLFGLDRDITKFDDAALTRAIRTHREVRKNLDELLRESQNKPDVKAEVEKIMGKGLELGKVSVEPGSFVPLPTGRKSSLVRVVPRGFSSSPWNYELIEPTKKTTKCRRVNGTLGCPDEWLLVEWADPSYPISGIGAANAILVPHTADLSHRNLSRFREVHEAFLRDVYVESRLRVAGQDSSPRIVYTSASNVDGSEFITRFRLDNSQLIGEARLVSGDPENQMHILAEEMSRCEGSNVLFYGDELVSVNLDAIAAKAGLKSLWLEPADPDELVIPISSSQRIISDAQLAEYLRSSGQIDSKCDSLVHLSCRLSILDRQPKVNGLSRYSRVRLLLDDPADLAEIIKSLSEAETKAFNDSSNPPNDSSEKCDPEMKMCITFKKDTFYPSFSVGCAGRGTLAISMKNGQPGFSIGTQTVVKTPNGTLKLDLSAQK